ncbi:hypothetical protein E2C01_024691 [Portunus trituberculatus]|uniref:Uncharacterized protein n=1 Tax=Portunus trituberculatus TaxID=210409 RepID=A0A5B7EEE4_PORTR|nr:hypothetical protein [Portunus trituberculatus]
MPHVCYLTYSLWDWTMCVIEAAVTRKPQPFLSGPTRQCLSLVSPEPTGCNENKLASDSTILRREKEKER